MRRPTSLRDIQIAKATKRAGREPNGYASPCDNIHCNVCRKARGEKAPWNR